MIKFKRNVKQNKHFNFIHDWRRTVHIFFQQKEKMSRYGNCLLLIMTFVLFANMFRPKCELVVKYFQLYYMLIEL